MVRYKFYMKNVVITSSFYQQMNGTWITTTTSVSILYYTVVQYSSVFTAGSSTAVQTCGQNSEWVANLYLMKLPAGWVKPPNVNSLFHQRIAFFFWFNKYINISHNTALLFEVTKKQTKKVALHSIHVIKSLICSLCSPAHAADTMFQ